MIVLFLFFFNPFSIRFLSVSFTFAIPYFIRPISIRFLTNSFPILLLFLSYLYFLLRTRSTTWFSRGMYCAKYIGQGGGNGAGKKMKNEAVGNKAKKKEKGERKKGKGKRRKGKGGEQFFC